MKKVLIQQSCFGIDPEVVTFETGATPEEVSVIENNSFDYGPGFSPFSQSSIQMFYESLLLGRSLPEIMVMNHIHHYANILAPTFFLFDSDIFSERASGLVSVVDRIERWGSIGFISCPKKIELLLSYTSSFFPYGDMSDNSMSKVMKILVEIFHQYLLKGEVPNHTLPLVSEPKILKQNYDFVLSEITSLQDIDYLYKQGFLSGICLMGDSVVVFKRSLFVNIPLEKIASKLGPYKKLDNLFIIPYRGEKDFVISLWDSFFSTCNH